MRLKNYLGIIEADSDRFRPFLHLVHCQLLAKSTRSKIVYWHRVVMVSSIDVWD